jgi:hypothetical protein
MTPVRRSLGVLCFFGGSIYAEATTARDKASGDYLLVQDGSRNPCASAGDLGSNWHHHDPRGQGCGRSVRTTGREDRRSAQMIVPAPLPLDQLIAGIEDDKIPARCYAASGRL